MLMIFDGETFIYEQAGKIIDSSKLISILELLIQLAEKIEKQSDLGFSVVAF